MARSASPETEVDASAVDELVPLEGATVGFVTSAFAVALAVLIGAVLILLSGASPIAAYGALIEGSLGSKFAIGETLARAAPLAIVGFGAAIALRAGAITIGAPGQVILGSIGALLTAQLLEGAPSVVAIPLVALGGAVFGALWVLLPALLRAYMNVNEILSTLIFNEFAFLLIIYLLNGPLADKGAITPKSAAFPDNSTLGTIIGGTRFHAGVFVAGLAFLAIILWVRSSIGFRYDLYGENPRLAESLGIPGTRALVNSLLISGAAAGLVGWIQAAGLLQRVYPDIAMSVGFFGLIVAMLGGARPLGVLAAAFLLGMLQSGALFMQSREGVPAPLSDIIQGLLLLGFAVRYAPQIAALARRLTRFTRSTLGVPSRQRTAS